MFHVGDETLLITKATKSLVVPIEEPNRSQATLGSTQQQRVMKIGTQVLRDVLLSVDDSIAVQVATMQ